jgi:nicotinic acid mononucleotide adenylyltransferase
MVPCGNRKDKNNKVSSEMRLQMCENAIKDYFPSNFPVKTCDIEVRNGESIPTYFLMKELEK